MIFLKTKTFFQLKSLAFLLPPALMTAFPFFSFYLKNITELSLKFITKPTLFSIIFSILGTLGLSILIKNKNKASFIFSLFVLIFFSYGHLSGFLNNKIFIQLPNQIVLGPDKILLPILFLLYSLFCFKIFKSQKSFVKTVNFLNISLILLVSYQAIIIGHSEYQKRSRLLLNSSEKSTSGKLNNQKNTPDIYYIILDGYAREDILKEIYNYDNSWFINSLRKMGFYVADEARSNYIHTYLSLPSTLNMRYLDELPKKYGESPPDDSAAKKLIAENEVTRKLKNYGYTIINFATIWEGTGESFKADITYKDEGYFKILGKNIALDESSVTFLQTTLLSPLIKEVWGDVLRAKTLSTLQKLPTIPFLKEKKFVFAHIIAPHPPYLFNADGKETPATIFEFASEDKEKYLNQLIFISKQILLVSQKIIQNSSTPPIIILQADHGPASILGKRSEWSKNYSKDAIKERVSILYSIYFPDHNYKYLYQSITPVNTFRILFNDYFGEKFEPLPDKIFFTDFERIYSFKEITDIK